MRLKFLKKHLIKPHQIKDKWYLQPLKKILNINELWVFRGKTIKPGFALGLFIAFIPVPGHTIIAILSAARLKINLPATLLGTLICNPLTIAPMFYAAYRLGVYILRLDERDFSFSLSYSWLRDSLSNTWEPLILGSFLMGLFSAVIGYFLMDICWKISINNYLKRKSKENKSTN
tara:strand:+ start:369 stop:893 length:525 start_codon:yes stop_codon:yes gene_type:complete